MRFKRLLDVTACLCAGLLVVPTVTVISIVLLFTQGRPVIFRQIRSGRFEQPFQIIKFRTMKPVDDIRAISDTARLTSIGRFLRRSSLDELPNLLNVLKGDMSLIGPRPLLVEYLPYYTGVERARFMVRPGLTGLAQTNGRNYLGWDKKLALDAHYANNVSFNMDIQILLNTIIQVLSAENVAADTAAVETYLDEERSEKL